MMAWSDFATQCRLEGSARWMTIPFFVVETCLVGVVGWQFILLGRMERNAKPGVDETELS